MRSFSLTITLKPIYLSKESRIMIMCTSARVIFIWIQLVSLCILTNTTPSLTRVKFQSNSHGELSQLTKKKTRRRTVSMANLAKKNLKKKLFSKMATLKMKTIV